MGGESMNIKIDIKGAIRGSLAKITVITLLTMIGIIAGITLLAFDYPVIADASTGHTQQSRTPSIEPVKPVNLTIRRVTAYNVGDRFQTDGSPCIGAGKENLCRALAQGEKVCAANFVPLNTYLYIQNYGIYRVADRMHRRFENRVDIAMEAHQKDKAMKFGVQNLPVIVLD
jgi:3D (Asp-Asp-Asp) domain-containing protein